LIKRQKVTFSRFNGAVAPWHHDTMTPWHHDTMQQRNYTLSPESFDLKVVVSFDATKNGREFWRD